MSYTTHIVCRCSSVIVKSLDGVFKIRSKVTIVKGNQAFAVCKDCNNEVAIPIYMDLHKINPPLIIKK